MFLDQRLRKATTFLLANVRGQLTEISTTFFVGKSLAYDDESFLAGAAASMPHGHTVSMTRHSEVMFLERPMRQLKH